jgi:hypothetical protein
MRGNPFAFVAVSLALSGPAYHRSGRKLNGDEGDEEDTGGRADELDVARRQGRIEVVEEVGAGASDANIILLEIRHE